jgi:hypothetical protein
VLTKSAAVAAAVNARNDFVMDDVPPNLGKCRALAMRGA